MSCCAKRSISLATGLSPRRSLTGSIAVAAAASGVGGGAMPTSRSGRYLDFEWTGEQPLLLQGQTSGRHYRFTHRGCRQTIDPLDWAQMFRVPGLRHCGA
jgi:hypothetical protein